MQTSLRTFAHLHGKNSGFLKVFGGLHSNFIHECVHIVHFPADVCFSTTFSKKRANVLKDVCSIYNLSKRPQGRLLNFWFLQISGLLEKRHSLVGGIFVEIGDVVVVDKIVTFLVVKILICY